MINQKILCTVAVLCFMLSTCGCGAETQTAEESRETVIDETPTVSIPVDPAFTVVIDPGHGGEDPGSVLGDCLEKDLNLSVALKLKTMLGEAGIGAVMTRESDAYLSSETRCGTANAAGADLFVSIHCNAFEEDAGVQGFEVHHHPNSVEGVKLAANVSEATALTASGATKRENKASSLDVLTGTGMPAILIELGFMTCPDELGRLRNGDYQDSLAEGILQGIVTYLGE